LNDTKRYGPRADRRLLEAVVPTRSVYFFGTIQAALGWPASVERHEVGPRLLSSGTDALRVAISTAATRDLSAVAPPPL